MYMNVALFLGEKKNCASKFTASLRAREIRMRLGVTHVYQLQEQKYTVRKIRRRRHLLGIIAIAVSMLLGMSTGAHAAHYIQDIPVVASTDDAEQKAGSTFSTTSPDLDLVFETTFQTIGLRFVGIDIPNGVVVTNAYIQFTADESRSGPTRIRVRAEASDNAQSFSTSSDVISRPRSDNEVLWYPPNWEAVGDAGSDQRTSDLSVLVQEIVNRPGWQQGNAIVILFEGYGRRAAESYDGSPADAPVLHLEYSYSDQQAPIVDVGPDQIITLPQGAVLSGSAFDDGLPATPGQVVTQWRSNS
jgi:hypothetical protein